MKPNARWMVALAVISGACLNGDVNSLAASSKEVDEAAAMMSMGDAKSALRRRHGKRTRRGSRPAPRWG